MRYIFKWKVDVSDGNAVILDTIDHFAPSRAMAQKLCTILPDNHTVVGVRPAHHVPAKRRIRLAGFQQTHESGASTDLCGTGYVGFYKNYPYCPCSYGYSSSHAALPGSNTRWSNSNRRWAIIRTLSNKVRQASNRWKNKRFPHKYHGERRSPHLRRRSFSHRRQLGIR